MSKRTFLGRRDKSNAFELLISYRHYFGVAATLSAFLLFAMTMMLSFPFVNHTANTDAAANPATTSLTMTTGHTGAGLDIIASNANGTFAASQDSDTAKFTVTTDNYTGYTLAIKGSNNNKQLANIDADATLDSIATDTGITADTFNTVAYNGKWGFKPSKINSVANTTKFYEAPSSDSPITLDTTSAANSTANEYSIGLGARVDYSNPAGTYSNTFILTAVTNPVSYTINYIDDTGDSTVASLPSAQSSTTTTTSVTLNPNRTPTRTGYTFAGKWCLGSINTSPASSTDYTTGTVCTGTEYASGDSVSFIDQTTATNTLNLYAMWTPETYSITINPGDGVNSVSLNGTSCSSSCSVSNLKYNNSYALTADIQSGYDFEGWSNSNGIGTIANTGSTNTTYTVGAGTTTLTATASDGTYTVSLSNTNATTYGSTSTTVTYGSSSITSITNPQRQYSVSGFSTSYNNASGASISSTSTKYYTYGFKGWYTSTSGGSQIINTSGNLVASTSYTDSNGRWNAKSGVTLYAQWNSGTSITLPTISKTGYNCGWTTSTSTSTITYASGYSGLTLTSNKTLYGVCKANTYTITLTNTNATSSGSTSATATYGSSSLTSITNPSRQYSVSGFYTSYNNASGATVSSTATKYYTYSFNGWWTSASGGTQVINTSKSLVANSGYANSSSQWTYTNNLILYARWNNGTSITLPTIYKSNYTCGWTTSTSTSSIMYTSGYSGLVPSSNMTLYGVCYYDPPTPTYSLYIDFAGTGVSSVQVRTSSGTSGSLMGTVSSSGGYVSGLYSGSSYYLYPSFSSGYEFSSWSKTSSYGSISSTTSSNPYFTMGSGTGRVTITGKSITYSLSVAFDSGISNVQVRTGASGTGTSMGTVYSSGGSVSGLAPGTTYYLFISHYTDYVVDSVSKTSTYGTFVESIRAFTMGSGNGSVNITSMRTLQSWSNCYNIPVGSTVTLADSRDGNKYLVEKLADGTCWMKDNLRLDLHTVTLSSLQGRTNASDTSLTYLKNGGGSNPYATTGASIGMTKATDMPYIYTAVKDDTASTKYGNGSHKRGVLYNYCAATAGTHCGSNATAKAEEDICPEGWKIPTIADSRILFYIFNNREDFRQKLSGTIVGYFYNGSLSSDETYFWTNDYSSTGSLSIKFSTSTGNVLAASRKVNSYGLSVRCINKDILNNKTIQEIGNMSSSEKASYKNAMQINTAYPTLDARDDQTYYIATLKDGNLWMVDNLNLGDDSYPLRGDLDSTNTNISTGITISTFDGWQKTKGTNTYTAPQYIPVSGTDSTSKTKYGTLYNFCAASGKTVCMSSNSGTSASYDLCPKGWRLPGSELSSLASYGSINTAVSSGGSAFSLPGSFTNTAPTGTGSHGYYWTKTYSDKTGMDGVYISRSDSGSTYIHNTLQRRYGYSVRCMLK